MTTAARTASFESRLARFRIVNAWWIRHACYALSILLLLGVWQALGHSFGVLFVPFTTTMSRLWDMLQGGLLLPGLLVSGKLYGVTLVINIVLGVGIGLALARIKLIAAAFEPYIYILYATPTIRIFEPFSERWAPWFRACEMTDRQKYGMLLLISPASSTKRVLKSNSRAFQAR